MTDPRILLGGLAFGESPRWHDGRLWVCDWGRQEVIAVAADGTSEVALRVPSAPICIDWLPDGRLLAVSGGEGRLLRRSPDGAVETHADLSGLSAYAYNEIVVDGRGNAYVNNIGFEFGGEVSTGFIALVTPDGAARWVADGLEFPNGMAITPDGSTLVVAESYAGRLTAYDIAADGGLANRRVWADLPGAHPDGICTDAEGAIWYADVPSQRCVRVGEGGEVLATVDLDRGCFSCALGGADGRTLFIVAARWDPTAMATEPDSGQVLTTPAPAPAPPRP